MILSIESLVSPVCYVLSQCANEFLNLGSFRGVLANPLTHEELENAKYYWIHQVQTCEFSQEIEILTSEKHLLTLSRLPPFVDRVILRVGGRLSHSLLRYEKRHLAILLQNSQLSTLIISYSHARTLNQLKLPRAGS